jgi:hypothetical protein
MLKSIGNLTVVKQGKFPLGKPRIEIPDSYRLRLYSTAVGWKVEIFWWAGVDKIWESKPSGDSFLRRFAGKKLTR